MPVAGLVLTLTDDTAMEAFAIESLSTLSGLTLGSLQEHHKLPVATDVDSVDEQSDLWQTIARIPGVLLVDLVFEDFSDVGEFSSEALPSRWRRNRERANESEPEQLETYIEVSCSLPEEDTQS